jgi:hypothetical protein
MLLERRACGWVGVGKVRKRKLQRIGGRAEWPTDEPRSSEYVTKAASKEEAKASKGNCY